MIFLNGIFLYFRLKIWGSFFFKSKFDWKFALFTKSSNSFGPLIPSTFNREDLYIKSFIFFPGHHRFSFITFLYIGVPGKGLNIEKEKLKHWNNINIHNHANKKIGNIFAKII